ncbi:polyhydroxyalkanoate synthesis repressor PhaR [Thalassobaculum sp. OXR-137]|uniref:polyhydroxyalkanoate synthesis repressor PhaR n=1 Tax=Thalassobaculum sp. OXR-137 TaxID=3100173 RepID=UPI002AC91DA7|nr:polyhydroxyalkanoate synthesis repressor PhaR [Thalassobaculum sp. OXR-137]WPZ34975.1 polyhydroxyalkanoate synthesis repressor PhaR [Thalassobaculum sp. OXR-137]
MTDSSKTDAGKKATRTPVRRSAAAKASTVGRRSEAEDGSGATGGAEPITIKKYANRRLYNTATSSYVTLDHLCQMVKDGVEFVVYDAKTSEDITRAVLTQIIVEEEAKGQNLLPIGFLRQLISFYGDNLQMVVPGYLESSMAAFSQNQERMRNYMQEAFGGMYPFGSIEDMTKRNLTMLEQAMSMFTPPGTAPGAAAPKPEPASAPAPTGEDTAAAVRQLQTQLEILQRQLMDLGTGGLGKRDSNES